MSTSRSIGCDQMRADYTRDRAISEEIFVFARLHARSGCETALEAAIRDVMHPTRSEPGCISYHFYRSLRDGQLFYIHSRWRSESAFDRHGFLPHTVQFVDTVRLLIDHELEAVRTCQLSLVQHENVGDV
jgi:quinol monooxygenase YgiN